jgi:Winged helix DNA-binding domain
MTVLTAGEVLALRLAAQRLDEASRAVAMSPREIVAGAAAIQAQDPRAAALGVRSRGRDVTVASVGAALIDERSLATAWLMRGTLHMVAAEDLAWMVALLGPPFIRSDRRRLAGLGVDDATAEAAGRVVRRFLAREGPSSRAAIAEALVAADFTVDPNGQATIHIVRRVALQGDVCLGPMRGGKPTYVLAADWLPSAPRPRGDDVDDTLARLAHRYLEAYGPAAPWDFAMWSGLGVAVARRAFSSIVGDLVELDTALGPLWTVTPPATTRGARRAASAPVVRLIPAFDGFLLGYRGRDLAVAADIEHHLKPGGGILRPAVLADGHAVASWAITGAGARKTAVVRPFAREMDASTLDGVRREVADIGRFLGVEVPLRME